MLVKLTEHDDESKSQIANRLLDCKLIASINKQYADTSLVRSGDLVGSRCGDGHSSIFEI